MDDPISYPGLITALLLPWFVGVVLTRALLLKSARYNWFILIGQGYFTGIFATTLVMRMSDWSGAGLNFLTLGATLALLGMIGGILQLLQRAEGNRPAISLAIPHWQKVVVTALLLLLAWRYVTMLQELTLRPLYAWDAWMNWAPKAIVWFHLEHLVEFVNPEQWLSQAPGLNSYTLGNAQASHYPTAVPLILLWSMMGAGTADHSYLFLPWILAAINLGLALYGYLRLNGISVMTATVACYLLLSVPYLNVHTALVGYADIWLAATFGLAVFALSEWDLSRSRSYAFLLLLMTLFCSQLKAPGVIIAAILICIFLRSILKLNYKTEMLLVLGLAVLVALVFWLGVDADIPYLGQATLSSNVISIPGLGSYSLEFHAVWGRFLESMFVMINWNILWYLLAAWVFIATLRGDLFRQAAPDTLAIVAAMTFLLLVFSSREDFQDINTITTLNRALLYLIPVIIFYLARASQALGPALTPKRNI